ncbi:MAG: hypothetical protein OXQ30_02420 [Boseongicola sp.]|nr:hypothetical protein [Boseongicola sp.]
MLKKAPQKPVPRASARKTIEDELAIPANWEERLAIARAKREKVLAAKARAEERQSYAHVEPAPKPQKPTITLDKAQRLRDRMSKDGKPDLVSVAPTPPKADLVAPPLEKLTPQEQEEPEAIAPIPVVSNKPLPELVAATLDVAPPEPVVAEKKRPALALIALASCVGLGLGLALGIGLTGGFSLQGSPSPTEPQIADGTLKTTPTVETPVNSAIVGATGANAPLETGPEIWQALLTNSPGPSNAVFATDAGVRIANANFSNPRMTVPLVEPVRVSAPANVGSDTIVRLPTGWTTAPRLAQLGLPAESVQSQLSAFQPIVRPKTENVLIAALGPDAFGALNLVTEPAYRVSITTSLSDAPALSTDDIFASAVPVSFVSASTPELRATLSIPVAPVPDAIAIRPSPLVNVLVSASSETPELNLPAFS